MIIINMKVKLVKKDDRSLLEVTLNFESWVTLRIAIGFNGNQGRVGGLSKYQNDDAWLKKRLEVTRGLRVSNTLNNLLERKNSLEPKTW